MPSTRPTVDPVLDILEELGYDFDELDGDGYKRSIREAIFRTHPDTGGKTADPAKFQILNEEFKKIRRGGNKPSGVEVKEKKSTIKGAKLLPGRGNFSADDIKPVDVEKKEGDAPALMPDRLDNIAKTVDSIALLLRRQFNLETKQQRDARVKQDKDNKDAREDDLEKKPNKKTGGLPKAIAKPALNFFEKIKNFFLNIAIGSAVFKMLDWLKDPANAEKIAKFSEFLINNAPAILIGLTALAALPTILTVVSVVQGILSGLALLGPLLPALPWILGGILVGAVAWWIGKKISKGITGGKVIGAERKENKDRLRAAGIQDATKNKLTLLDPKTGQGRMKVRKFGENSITGRDFNPIIDFGSQEDEVELDLMKPKHAAWYVKNYGQAALEEKLAAHKSFRDTKAALVDTKKDKQKAIREARKEWYTQFEKEGKELGFDTDGSDNVFGMAIDFFRKSKKQKDFEKKKSKEWEIKKLEIEKEFDEKAIKIGDDVIIQKNSSSATIDKNIKKETNIAPPNTKGKGNTTIIGGGSQQQSVGGGGGGTTGSSAPSFSSQDPNNLGTFSTQGMYNMVG